MSFSFSIVGNTKTEAKHLVAKKMAATACDQPSHAADLPLILQTVGVYVDAVPEKEGFSFSVAVHGSVSWTAEGVTGLSCGVSVYHVPPQI